MRNVALLSLTMFILVTGKSAHAVELQDCSKGTTKARLDCLQANTVLLNSSYQTVAAELRKSVADLRTQIGGLNQKLVDLNAKVDAIKLPPPPDLSGVVRRGQSFKLGFDRDRCLSFATGVTGNLAGPDKPIPAQLLMLLQDCGGSPPLSVQ
jgi:hypothetical protein